jgi:hypothetical protein
MDVTDAAMTVAQTIQPTRQVGIAGTPLTIPGLGIWSLVVMAIIALIKAWPLLRRISADTSDKLQAAMLARIARLEERCDGNEAECQERIDLALKTNDARWELRFAEMKREHDTQVDGLRRQIITLQVTLGGDYRKNTNDSAIGKIAEMIDKRISEEG